MRVLLIHLHHSGYFLKYVTEKSILVLSLWRVEYKIVHWKNCRSRELLKKSDPNYKMQFIMAGTRPSIVGPTVLRKIDTKNEILESWMLRHII